MGVITLSRITIGYYNTISKYLKDCECMKSLVNDVVITCDEIVETPKCAPINPSDGINHWLIAVALLAITCYYCLRLPLSSVVWSVD